MDQNDIKRLEEVPYSIMSSEMIKAKKKHDHTFKIILIGNSAVGKSSLMRKIMDYDGTKFFQHAHQATIGVEHGSTGVKIHGKTVKLDIFDTAGQEQFKAMSRTFYRQANLVLLTYDMTDERSFEEL